MTRVHREIIGQGPPLILLHGWGWHSGIWQPLVPQLSQSFQLFLFDLPGCGKSPPLNDKYSFENIAEFILPEVPDKAIWLGWSLGGMLAWWVALHYPEKINHLVTVASSPRFVQDGDWPGVAPLALEKFSQSLMDHYETTLQDFLELQLRGTPHQQALFSELKTVLFSEKKPEQKALQGGLELLRDTDLRNQSLNCPSLHIFGSLDALVPKSVASLVQSQLPQSQCNIIKHIGHMPFLSHAFLPLLKNIITS